MTQVASIKLFNSSRGTRYSSPYGTRLDKNDIMLSIKSIIKELMVRKSLRIIFDQVNYQIFIIHILLNQYSIEHLISNLGALIVYDITDLESWSKVSKWVKELQMYLPPDTPIIITGNKCDIPNRQIPIDEAER